jgi:hypothetical protein
MSDGVVFRRLNSGRAFTAENDSNSFVIGFLPRPDGPIMG